jgi:hypothetical protein
LSRLSISEYATAFVLKGGVLLAAYDTRRPTRDIDLQAAALANDGETIRSVVAEIAQLVS